jgi:hypothetical protein
MAGTVSGDRLNQFIREQPYFSAGLSTQVEKRADNYWYWRNTGLPVNIRRANGRSGRNVAASAKAAQAARRAGPGAGPVSAREMYAQLKAEVEGELKARGLLPVADECPINPPQALDDLEQIFKDSEAIYPEARGLLVAANMAGGSKYKQRGGAFMDQLKRLMTILCMLPRETVRVVDQEATAVVRQTADALLQDLPHTAETGARVLQRIPAGLVALLVAGDLGSNNSLTVRAINAIISVIGYFVNPALTMSWYRGLLGNIASLVYGSTPELAGIAAVIAINYQGVRIFQEIYRRLRGEAEHGPDRANAAQHAFEGTVVQFIGYLTRRARMEALRRLPAERLPAGLRQEVLDAELADYMARVPDAQELRRIRENQIAARSFGVGVLPRLANHVNAEGPGAAGAAAAAPSGYNWLGVLRGELPAAGNVNDMENRNVAPGPPLTPAQLNAELAAYMARHPGRLASAHEKKTKGGRGKSRRASKRTAKHRKNTRKA